MRIGREGRLTYRSADSSDLLHRLKMRTDTAMAAKDLVIDNSREREAVEAVCECFPELEIVIKWVQLVVVHLVVITKGTFAEESI